MQSISSTSAIHSRPLSNQNASTTPDSTIRDIFSVARRSLSTTCFLDLSSLQNLSKKTEQKQVKHLLPDFIKQFQDIQLKISNQHPALIKYALENGFIFEQVDRATSLLRYNLEYNDRYLKLSRETKAHIDYLESIGLGERGKNIQLKLFKPLLNPLSELDLTSFQNRTSIPEEALYFNPYEKNTLITTDPNKEGNDPDDLKKILDVRLYPVLRNLLKTSKVEVFLGSIVEMTAYYHSRGLSIELEFKIPSSATYFLAQSEKGESIMIMAGLVGRENIIAQLITLKLADISIENVELIGEYSHFDALVNRDIVTLFHELPEIKANSQILIVAGCGLKEKVTQIVGTHFKGNLKELQHFQGSIISISYTPFIKPIQGIHGCISLDTSYGEVMGTVIKNLLENCYCPHVFTGGACGYIPGNVDEARPKIGTRIPITRSMNETGEVTSIGASPFTHLQIPSIFLETYAWLEQAKKRGSTIDVETFYMVRAIEQHNKAYPERPIKADCGCFVSDYVGEEPLREYSQVFRGYEAELSKFFTQALQVDISQPKTMIYDPKLQTTNDIIIRNQTNDPRIPQAPGMDISFLSEIDELLGKANYRSDLIRLNPKIPEDELFKNKLWDISYFDKENYPVVLGQISDRASFSTFRNQVGLRFLDMPIFMPNQGWRIPPELEQFKEVILKAITFEKLVSPDFEKKCYVYVTVHQGEVMPKEAQRREGWHGDSVIKTNSQTKKLDIACDHVYVIADNCPTPFLPGPFSFNGVDPESTQMMLTHFAKGAENKTPMFYPNYTLLRLDPYCIHNVGFNETSEPVKRTFIKVSVSEAKYCKLGNAVNPQFHYDWPMIPRHKVPYDRSTLQKSSHRRDRDQFMEINPYTLDLSKEVCRVSWAKSVIQTAIRVKEVTAEPAKENELLTTTNDGFLVTILNAEKGDFKVTASHGDQYFLSGEKLQKFYDADPSREGVYIPKKISRKFVELTENVRFMASWGTLQYANKGDILMFVDKNDI